MFARQTMGHKSGKIKSKSENLNEQMIPTKLTESEILSISDFTNLLISLPANDFAQEDFDFSDEISRILIAITFL